MVLSLASPFYAQARGNEKSDYKVLSPKIGWTGKAPREELTWGVSYSHYPNYNLGYTVAVNQMFGGPEIEASAKAMVLSIGLGAGPFWSREGVGVAVGAYTSLIYLGVEVRSLFLQGDSRMSATFFIPFWWRNGKFWDVNGAIGPMSMSGYH